MKQSTTNSNFHKNKVNLALGLLIATFFLLALLAINLKDDSAKLYMNGREFKYILADTQEERQIGLSQTEVLQNDEAMVFIFPNAAKHGIWMLDMKFPIDIIWLDNSKKVVDLEESVPPETYPSIFYPENDASYVVEANAGTIDSTGLNVGDTLQF